MTVWLDIAKHLLPRGRAWRITSDKKLRQLVAGVASAGEDAQAYVDGVYAEVDPQTTTSLLQWEDQWALPPSTLSESGRRDRLDAVWKALGGQSPRYIQDTLQARGFDVYVHEWWAPGTEPTVGVHSCTTPRSPLALLRREYTFVTLFVECGEPLAQCGEPTAQCGNGPEPRGYPLVNRIARTAPDYLTLCGEELAECGEELAECGSFLEFRTDYEAYTVPSDPTYWSYFLYIGAEDINDVAQVDPSRREEFEALCLKICPAHLWLGVIVEYV